MRVTLPNNWQPRPYQWSLWCYLRNGGKRAVAVWHRRAGKDSLALNFTAIAAMTRPGNYLHALPEYEQGRKAIWTAVDYQGRRVIDQAFPQAIRARTDNQGMFIEFVNGSTWQVAGSDRYDSLMGTNPKGIVFSEYSIADPDAWQYLRPILRENGGWALFIYTPRGQGHGKELYDLASSRVDDPEEPWFSELLTVSDTDNEGFADAERRDGMPEENIQQEYYGSWIAPNSGAVFGKELYKARQEGRIGTVPIESGIPVQTFWDLGINDAMAIWFAQVRGQTVNCVDYYEGHNSGFGHYAKVLYQEKGYLYGTHYAPHDIEQRVMDSAVVARTRKEHAADAGIRFVTVPRIQDKADSIESARRYLSLAYFDESRCKRGVNALEAYGYAYDEKGKVYRDSIAKNWARHGADAFQTMALADPIHRGTSPVVSIKRPAYGRAS